MPIWKIGMLSVFLSQGIFFLNLCSLHLVLARFEELPSSFTDAQHHENGKLSFFSLMNELRQSLVDFTAEDAIPPTSASTENGSLNTGDFAFVPYPASDIVDFQILDSNKEKVDWNPNQYPTYVTQTTLAQLVDLEGNFHPELCEKPHLFVGEQVNICRSYLALMPALVRGYATGINECEFQFRDQKWNCQGHNHTALLPNNRRLLRQRRQLPLKKRVRTYMDLLISRSSKEAAYVLAVTSAGIMHSVTKACSSGKYQECGCDSSKMNIMDPNSKFTWGGCSDNVAFGEAIARAFLDSAVKIRHRRNPKVVNANLHNNIVGRYVVTNSLDKRCKCHGASGSCELKSCWQSLPEFRVIGKKLRELYDQSRQVDMQNGQLVMKPEQTFETRFARGTLGFRVPPYRNPGYLSRMVREPTSPDRNQLVFLTESPNFCHHNALLGSLGTSGRVCQISEDTSSHCDVLCCGRGYVQQRAEVTRKCKCKFIWCCEVKCELCKETISIYRCR